jgi:hypothetical protein
MKAIVGASISLFLMASLTVAAIAQPYIHKDTPKVSGVLVGTGMTQSESVPQYSARIDRPSSP